MPSRAVLFDMALSVSINIDELRRKLHGLGETAAKVERLTIADMRHKAPPPVNKAVTEVYNIKARNVKSCVSIVSKKNDQRSDYKGLDSVALVYSGRRLTGWPLKAKPMPQRVGKMAYSAKRKYSVTHSVFKGKWTSVSPADGNRLFIIRPKTKDIPIQAGKSRKLKVLSFSSVPQAVMHENVVKVWQPEVTRRIYERMTKHYLYLVKKT